MTTQPISSWHGSLDLVYSDRDGETQIAHALIQAPLKVQRPFYPESKAICHSVILHTAGGIVGGDRLSQTIKLQSQANALITTAAAGKVYRSNGQTAKQTINIDVESGACLEWLPQETIIFNGALYHQNLRVELAPGANFLGWEITRFGRSARGEKFLAGEWRSHTEIWQQGKPLFIDRQWLSAGETIINSPVGLAGHPIVASLIWIGKPVSPEIIEQARSLWEIKKDRGEAGVTTTQALGLLCRYRGSSTEEVQNWFIEVWQLLRRSLLERGTIKPRVWMRSI
ncbi:urease accessory protein UreD [Candidatus Gracilibacteria bacterium]|nr:urease accessory protein UreD [Candidatus Gracilibacteria bacterium]NJM86007.1 urease accessory protein UreD [Hydrococcus sp. RU_2_2]NJP17663.1 urease accessory protein UreD [Hydrococcus sp. CRU_1_1]NJQ98203.1 urease accessory protein UreD [Hydrococcus sp. CSU_1_8]